MQSNSNPRTVRSQKKAGRQSRRAKKTGSARSGKKKGLRSRIIISKGMLIIIGLFLALFILLLLRSYIVVLNRDVQTLQTQLSEINSEIDSKNGRLISNTDLKEIEAKARSYGMTEAKPSQYVYETAAKKQKNITNNQVGLYDYINFFVQLRNEGLWPQAQ